MTDDTDNKMSSKLSDSKRDKMSNSTNIVSLEDGYQSQPCQLSQFEQLMGQISMSCFDGMLPAELVKWLTKQADQFFKVNITPIWLNNDGHNVIGLIPKTTFTLQLNEQTQKLTLNEKHRQDLNLAAIHYSNQCYENTNLIALQNRLIAYQQQQPTQDFDNENGYQNSYQNGWIGFISYDVSADNLANRQLNVNFLAQHQPLAYFGHYDIYLTLKDHQWQLNATSPEAAAELENLHNWLNKQFHLDSDFSSKTSTKGLDLLPVWTITDYATAFEQVQAYLKAGDCYQINLTQCWQGQCKGEKLVDYLPQLQQATQAPFAGFLALADYELLSCSPELFFIFSKNNAAENIIITKPIKGTRPRGQHALQDEILKQDLATSEKDIAENVMIVDLLRNDLGKYAKTGTVSVPKLFDIESFSNVHHMVSTITATLKDDVHPLTVLFESLPAGSITGTPKKRAVEIIHELEAKPRGAYCGTLGYMNFDGTGQWNVLIRTLQATHNDVSLWAGGGVTIASSCEAEYQECFDKVGNLLKVLQNKTD